MSKVFRINTINSDGTAAEEKLIEYYVLDDKGKPFLDADGNPEIVITLRPISQRKYREVEAANTEHIPARKGQPPRQEVDYNGVQDDLVAYAVVSWKGVVGADDKPLDCIRETKVGLPGDIKNEVIARAMQGEAVNAAASFRSAS